MADEPLPTAEAFALLEKTLAAQPRELFQRVGGEVAFFVLHGAPERWTVRLDRAGLRIVPEECVAPVLLIGIEPHALTRLVRGTLDVERAMQNRHLIVQGDDEALRRFAA